MRRQSDRLGDAQKTHKRFSGKSSKYVIQQRNLFAAEIALREMGNPSLLVALDYLELLADGRPDKFDRA
jgi:hypothetical protein